MNVKVWDRAVRGLHAALIAAVAMAAVGTVWWVGMHRPAGHAACAIVALRIAWGLAGGGYARFSQFVPSPRATVRYLRQLVHGREPRHLGHNPLGAWMVLALMACVLVLGLTGWLYTTDRFWGAEWVEQWHRGFAWGLLALVALHVAGVAFTSFRHRENLVRAMFDGMKRSGERDDIA